MTEIITSLQNPKIKQVVKLREARERKERGLILIEGRREISLALEAGVKIDTLFYCPELADEDNEFLLLINKKVIINTTSEVFKKIAYRENPDGFLAIGKSERLGLSLSEIKLSPNPLLVILEAVEKPGNLGAILRSADAGGADAVIVSDAKTDIYNPNVIRASLGTVFTNQIAISSTAEVLKWLKNNKIKSFAATPSTQAFYTKADYRGPSAIIVGAEHTGLSDSWLKEADEKIKIPMKGRADSLNTSVSLAIVLFEALRQRGV